MRKIYLILFILVLFISMGSVAATGNFTQLNDEITHAGDVYTFTQDYVYTDDTTYNISNQINIESSNFVIEGNNFAVDGQNQSRLFKISGENVTINNLKIINTNYTRGSGLYVTGSVILNNVTFINNHAYDYGGAILTVG